MATPQSTDAHADRNLLFGIRTSGAAAAFLVVLIGADVGAIRYQNEQTGDQKGSNDSIAAFEKAVQLDPKNALAHYNLGVTLLNQKRLDDAIAALRKSIAIDPTSANAQGSLGLALLRRGQFAEAIAATQKALDLLPAKHATRGLIGDQLRRAQLQQGLEEEMDLVLSGKQQGDAAAFVAFARLCRQYKQRYATATRLFRKAFVAKTDGPVFERQHRYDAACAAGLASLGRGDEASQLTGEERAKMRALARGWLQAELDHFGEQRKANKARPVLELITRLENWLLEPDLAGLREPKELAKLTENERAPCEELRASVRAALKEAHGRFRETPIEGALTAKETHQLHKVKMSAGKTYVIDLESSVFDAFLILEDPQGKKLDENDDFAPDNPNSRLMFTPKEDGEYRVTATSFEQRGVGAYKLRIREFVVAK